MTTSLPIPLLGQLAVVILVCVSHSAAASTLGERATLSEGLGRHEEHSRGLKSLVSSGDPAQALENWSSEPTEGRTHHGRGIRGRFLLAEEDDGTSDSQSSSGERAKKWIVGVITGLVAGTIAAVLVASTVRFVIFTIMNKPVRRDGPIIFDKELTPKMLAFMEDEEQLNQAMVLVGSGGAGRVYRAKLQVGENQVRDVAIKAVDVNEDEKGLFGQKQIHAELETLGLIRHRNLVTLLAYVHRRDLHLLVYPYMKNGSLQDALTMAEAGELEMPWKLRLQIAVCTAEGLAYLHVHSSPRILHRDLKPSNILLDEDFVAHLADFGLAKVLPGTDTHVSDSGVPGTRGYIAPEYHQTGLFTTRSDVYSFGVILAVLLTGMDPTDVFFHTAPGGDIGGWLQSLLTAGNGAEAIHSSLKEFHDEILLALKVAVFCTNNNPNDRPTIQDALVMLKQIQGDKEVTIPTLQPSPDNRPLPVSRQIPDLITSSG